MTEVATPASTRQYVLCGTLQLLIFLGYASLAGLIVARGYDWIDAASTLIDVYLRSALFGGALFVGLCSLPIVAKWLLIGRWKAGEFPVWSLTHVRFWLVKALLHGRSCWRRWGSNITLTSRRLGLWRDVLDMRSSWILGTGTFVGQYRTSRRGVKLVSQTSAKVATQDLCGVLLVYHLFSNIGGGVVATDWSQISPSETSWAVTTSSRSRKGKQTGSSRSTSSSR